LHFLNTALLAGLLAAILPLLIHLFTRAKARPVPFSSLRFLRQLQIQKIRRIRLRQILLLVLRTLIVLLLVLAFARPTCRTAGSAPDPDARSSAVLIVDNSASMTLNLHGRTLLDDAKTTAAGIIPLLHPGDEIFLLTTTDTLGQRHRAAFHDFDLLRRQISAIEPAFQRTDITAALHLAHRLLRESANINKEIYLVSDLQANGFRQDSLAADGTALRTYALPVRGEQAYNLALEEVRWRSTILQKGKPVELDVKVANRGVRPARNSLAQIFLDDQQVAQGTVTIGPGNERTETFRFILDRGGLVAGRVQLEDDDLSADNRRYFSLRIPDRLQVGLVSSSPATDELLVMALQSGGTAVNVLRCDPRALSFDSLQVVLLNDVAPLDERTVAQLRDFVQGGGGLIVAAGRTADLRWYSQVFNPALGLPPFTETISGGSFSLGRMDLTHPLFTGVFERLDAPFTSPQFSFALRLKPTAAMQSILSFSSGDPYLVENRLGQGTLLLFTSGFDPQESDIAYRAIFAPLLHRCLVYLGLRSQNQEGTIACGTPWRSRLPKESLGARFTVARPDDQTDQVQPQALASGAWVRYEDTGRPGIYLLRANARAIDQWAVNIDPEESDLRMLTEDRLEKNFRIAIVTSPQQLADALRRERVGRELWRYFVGAALALLVVEMLIYREKGEEEIGAEPPPVSG